MRRRSLITIDVVAAEAGVSASTVSPRPQWPCRSGAHQRVDQGARARRCRPARLHARTTPPAVCAASGPASSPSWSGGCRARSSPTSPLASAHVAERYGYQVGVIDAGAVDQRGRGPGAALLRTGICDGVVVATSSHSHRGPARTPCWSWSRAVSRPPWCWIAAPIRPMPAIDIDNASGLHLATQHLLRLGHRRIAHFNFGDAPLDPTRSGHAVRTLPWLPSSARRGWHRG